jgi:hypothetical protein
MWPAVDRSQTCGPGNESQMVRVHVGRMRFQTRTPAPSPTRVRLAHRVVLSSSCKDVFGSLCPFEFTFVLEHRRKRTCSQGYARSKTPVQRFGSDIKPFVALSPKLNRKRGT